MPQSSCCSAHGEQHNELAYIDWLQDATSAGKADAALRQHWLSRGCGGLPLVHAAAIWLISANRAPQPQTHVKLSQDSTPSGEASIGLRQDSIRLLDGSTGDLLDSFALHPGGPAEPHLGPLINTAARCAAERGGLDRQPSPLD